MPVGGEGNARGERLIVALENGAETGCVSAQPIYRAKTAVKAVNIVRGLRAKRLNIKT